MYFLFHKYAYSMVSTFSSDCRVCGFCPKLSRQQNHCAASHFLKAKQIPATGIPQISPAHKCDMTQKNAADGAAPAPAAAAGVAVTVSRAQDLCFPMPVFLPRDDRKKEKNRLDFHFSCVMCVCLSRSQSWCTSVVCAHKDK